ncbi:T9SS type A sorting domain-containing protein [Flavobacterium sp. '19STA2R22 D10 B1']|uniref:T9SS type A sorting domain-containing protein n=1 Tax=Flavobacterium aerium TaxID=3037261 RepID=UPI00278BE59A|nr:T9SS type A sorting domain-containing protein [Flavobacterium sp. '19STA2R22 D10 B1']
MKIILLSWLTFFSVICSIAQTNTKTFELMAVAEGNFGTPNGDIFNVASQASASSLTTGPFYGTANNLPGLDVLQDFQIIGDKAILLSKANTYKVVVVDYPSFTNVATFTNIGAPQTLTDAGETKAYVSTSNNSSKLYQIDLVTNTTTPVVDPTNAANSYSNYMLYANGAVYVVYGTKIVKVDVTTNTVTSVIQPNIGAIEGIQYDAENNNVWLLGKVASTSTLLKMDVANNDVLSTPITLTGVSNAKQLRFAKHKLYFLNNGSVHLYTINTPNIPTTGIYTTAFTGYGAAYGKAFTVDPESGDFAIGSANNFSADSSYEIVDGTTYQLIETGNITGCKIVNELSLKTFDKLSVGDHNVSINYVVYPNPTKDILNIRLDTKSIGSAYTVTLINPWGATVKQVNSINNNSTIDVSDLASGIYFAQIKEANSTKSIVKKVVITH